MAPESASDDQDQANTLLRCAARDDRIARAIHEHYVHEAQLAGIPASDDPSRLPWDQLPESLRASNRDQAADIERKLRLVGCQVVRATGAGPEELDFRFNDAEVEHLAELEHERWVRDRRRRGWQRDGKNVPARTTPYLTSWDEIGDEARELDRQAVRAIPAILASIGLSVRRADRRGGYRRGPLTETS